MSEVNTFIYNSKELINNSDCPHCSQNIKLYPRKLNKNHMFSLIQMFRRGQLEWHYYIDVSILGTNDISKLAYWGLIIKKQNDDSEKNSSGMWKLTFKGVEFLLGKIQIPKYCYTYNNEVFSFSDEQVHFNDLCDEKFNFQELMDGEVPVINQQTSFL